MFHRVFSSINRFGRKWTEKHQNMLEKIIVGLYSMFLGIRMLSEVNNPHKTPKQQNQLCNAVSKQNESKTCNALEFS